MSSTNNANKDQTSTLQSYIDSAAGTVQSTLGSLLGSNADQAQGEQKKAEAQAESDISHTAAKAGPFTLSSSGAVAKDNQDRTAGSYNQTVGSAKEFVGNLVGSEDLKTAGVKQNQEGKAQEAQGQLQDLGQGISDRVGGTVGGVVAGLTGDKAEQERRQQQHDQGKTLQRGVEADVQKTAEAEQRHAQA